jgi:N-acetylmuramoyl-L-alanine amidase
MKKLVEAETMCFGATNSVRQRVLKMKGTISEQRLRVVCYSAMLYALCAMLSGCATVPKPAATPSYVLNGTSYIPLTPLCTAERITWQYDAVTKTVTLSQNAHRVCLRIGDKLALADGAPLELNYPVDIYRGIIVVPAQFKQQVLEKVFKGYPGAAVLPPIFRIKKVVLDPGHGGKQVGAIGKSGLREKEVNLDIARRLSKLLQAQGMEVVLTRNSDKIVSLAQRAKIANNSRAEFFLSIHANANRVRSLKGFEVYYLSPWVSDAKRAYAAATSYPLDLENATLASNSLDLKAILWDMIYTSNRAEAIELARSLCKTAEGNLGVRVLGLKPARFEVLRETNMPAILIEVGFLSNPQEERKLKNSYYRQQIAEAIAQAVADYRKTSI